MNKANESGSRLLTCCISDQWLAVPVEALSEVVTPQARTLVPLAPNAVNGLINLRGRIMSELDMRKILELPSQAEGSPYRTIILEDPDGESFGLTVDRVGEVITMDSEHFERAPDSLEERWKGVCHGVLKQKKRMLVILDVERVIARSLPGNEN